MSGLVNARVLKNTKVAPDHYRLTLAAPEAARAARPGQFLHVRCGNTYDPILRRPISIHAVDQEKGEVTLLYRLAGRGTAILSEKRTGEQVSLLGPLGSGFSLPREGEKVSLVAGGIGIAPLFFLLQELARQGNSAAVFWGAANRKHFLSAQSAGKFSLLREIRELGHRIILATDDGSVGYPGLVTELFEQCVQGDGNGGPRFFRNSDALEALERCKLELAFQTNFVYGCGPRAMLSRLCRIIENLKINGEISLEERMGCGVGACLSCACKIREGGEDFYYRRACLEGPVFPAGEVVWP